MSQSIIIAAPSSWNLATFTPALETVARARNATFGRSVGQLSVVAKEWRWKLILNDESNPHAAAEGYETNEDLPEQFRRGARSFAYFMLGFDDLDVTRGFLRDISRLAVDAGEIAWLDTDYGWVIDAADFLKRTDDDPSWDWRHLAPPRPPK